MSIEAAIKQCYTEKSKKGFVYKLPKNFPAFNGHFEGYPLLPAVCHISFCADAAGRLTGKKLQLGSIKRAKFLSPSLPETIIEVRLTLRPDGFYSAELVNPADNKVLSRLILNFTEIA